MPGFNIITFTLFCVFLLPILIAVFEPFSKEKVRHSFASMLGNIEFLLGLLASIYLTKKIFFENDQKIFKQIYERIPQGIRTGLYGQDVLVYLCAVPVLLIVILFLLRLVTTPLFKSVIEPVSNWVYKKLSSLGSTARRTLAALWNVPKAVFVVLIFGLLLNFYAYYFSTPLLSKWMNESNAYQLLYKNALYPVLNSNIAKQVPVLFNETFKKTTDNGNTAEAESDESFAQKLAKQLSGGNIRVIEYFNGVTLDEAIKSSSEIDEAAKKIVGQEKDSKRKAQLIYKWITKNIVYDNDKAVKVSAEEKGITSGSKIAFQTKKGICFDYSCLYVSMCRAVGLNVRLVTGLGYSGTSWGDHAWNQVYSTEEKRWINVDSTFGTVANYFDKRDFKVDHKDAEVQGEW